MPAYVDCSSADVPMRFTAAAPLGISGIKSSAVMGSLGLYRCAALATERWSAELDWGLTGVSGPLCKPVPCRRRAAKQSTPTAAVKTFRNPVRQATRNVPAPQRTGALP
jgi:hypothetical protein